MSEIKSDYLGIILNLPILNNGNVIIDEDKNDLLRKLNNRSFSAISIYNELNYGLLNVKPHKIKELIDDIKMVTKCKIILVLSILGDLPMEYYANNPILTYFDDIVLDLKTSSLVINDQEKKKILSIFYAINKKKIFLNEEFLNLNEEILQKYCQGFCLETNTLPNHLQNYKSYNIINFTIKSFSSKNILDNLWNDILCNNVHRFIYLFSFTLIDILDILNCILYFNDHQMKIEIINKIRDFENTILQDNNYYFNNYYKLNDKLQIDMNNFIENILQKKNDLLYFINQ